jgi:hypothetical protein
MGGPQAMIPLGLAAWRDQKHKKGDAEASPFLLR